MTKKGIKLFKIGGSILDSGREIKKLIDCLKKKIEPGKAILVHGGGSAITRWLDAFGVEVEFVNGQRVTDEKSMKVVEMVLSGLINKKLVSILNRAGYRAIGISGRDAGIA
ncbi:MAG: acetylglutamate kinase, partial [Atribacterota bacterium]